VVHNRKKFEDELIAAKKAAEKALQENTALLQAKNELQQQAELLDQQMYLVKKQNEELMQFNHVVTHEMQEPLRKLFVFTNMLIEDEDSATVPKTVLKIKSVAEQMRTTLSGLQQYVWLVETPVKPRRLDLNRLVDEAVQKLRSQNPAMDLKVHMDDLPGLFADAEQTAFLLHEILSNAVRFRKEENMAVLTISASQLQSNKFRAISGKYQLTPCIKLEMQDDGVGFDPAYKEQAFSLFKRLHEKSGSGIGLSLCKKIVENHQGTISIESLPGKGTTVTITWPQEERTGAETSGNEHLKTPTADHGKTETDHVYR
jgi:sigma-B regulation protein RsbU (phosphoserine phosphatase)